MRERVGHSEGVREGRREVIWNRSGRRDAVSRRPRERPALHKELPTVGGPRRPPSTVQGEHSPAAQPGGNLPRAELPIWSMFSANHRYDKPSLCICCHANGTEPGSPTALWDAVLFYSRHFQFCITFIASGPEACLHIYELYRIS